MAGASLLALLDDIATLLDDIAAMSKVAARKTAGMLGDDLALNAQQVTGVDASRELPVVFAVALGSLRNKLILVPAALLISAFVPWLITPLLVCGGLYLCFEGAEKLIEKLLHHGGETPHEPLLPAPGIDPVAYEAAKVKGAIRTDFVLSAEIIVIALGIVSGQSFLTQLGVLAAVGVALTIIVYGVVAAIVKLDDVGLYLFQRSTTGAGQSFGKLLLAAAPRLMKVLAVVGTAAMFTVGGGILAHRLAFLHGPRESVLAVLPGGDGALGTMLVDALVGVLAGVLLAGLFALVAAVRRKPA